MTAQLISIETAYLGRVALALPAMPRQQRRWFIAVTVATVAAVPAGAAGAFAWWMTWDPGFRASLWGDL